MITFADDTIIFATNPVDSQDKLKTLEKYSDLNDIFLNPIKTNILHFFKGRPISPRPVYYQGNEINYVREATYLDVTFTSSVKFLTHAKNTVKKSQLAPGKTLAILFNMKSNSWQTKNALFDSLIKSVLLYASEIWAWNYVDLLETVQSKFFKRLLQLPIETPNYFLRAEITD